MMAVLDFSTFEQPTIKIRHYYVYIRDSDDVSKIFQEKMAKWLSAETIFIYYDRAESSELEAKLIASLLDTLQSSIEKIVLIPINECVLEELDEQITESLIDGLKDEFVILQMCSFGLDEESLFITKVSQDDLELPTEESPSEEKSELPITYFSKNSRQSSWK